MANTSNPGVALRFVGFLDRGDDLVRHGHAEVGGDERGFEFLERFAGRAWANA